MLRIISAGLGAVATYVLLILFAGGAQSQAYLTAVVVGLIITIAFRGSSRSWSPVGSRTSARSRSIARSRRRSPRSLAAADGGYSQRNVLTARTTAPIPHRARIANDCAVSPPVAQGDRKASARAAAGNTPAIAASGPGRSATGRMIPPSSRHAMNRPFASARVASARSEPASGAGRSPRRRACRAPARGGTGSATRSVRDANRARPPRSPRAGRPGRARR